MEKVIFYFTPDWLQREFERTRARRSVQALSFCYLAQLAVINLSDREKITIIIRKWFIQIYTVELRNSKFKDYLTSINCVWNLWAWAYTLHVPCRLCFLLQESDYERGISHRVLGWVCKSIVSSHMGISESVCQCWVGGFKTFSLLSSTLTYPNSSTHL